MYIYPLVFNILIKEKEINIETDLKGKLYTQSALSIFEIFNYSLDLLISKRIKDLILKYISVVHEILF